ncbi:hypothetical protein C823_006055 [Eubacterium plexicaudatum ASF492]|uniref:Uncharacterized protein n=1 Tax=Eubacterium plexicaudatum ASF492 TaxID=1235802 RepID=N2AKB9_9FIRM|nr:hypothetical protein C823_006055 [Eubacterium plexicaudatum ASF492]
MTQVAMIFEEEKQQAVNEAAIKTTVEECKYFGASKQGAAERIIEKFNISQNEAVKMVKNFGSLISARISMNRYPKCYPKFFFNQKT